MTSALTSMGYKTLSMLLGQAGLGICMQNCTDRHGHLFGKDGYMQICTVCCPCLEVHILNP